MNLAQDFDLKYSAQNNNTRNHKGATEMALMNCPQAWTFYQKLRKDLVSVYQRKPNRVLNNNVEFLLSADAVFVEIAPEGAAFRAYPAGPGDAIGWFRRANQQLTLIDANAGWVNVAIVPQPTVTVMQAAGGVTGANHGQLNAAIDDWVPIMTNWLATLNHWTANQATGFGAQHTPNGCTEGTNSLDFQGIRQGTNNTFWIDLQAQSGGGGSPRRTYGQVMIQTRIGRVADNLIVAALRQSLTGGAQRALIRAQNSQDTPV